MDTRASVRETLAVLISLMNEFFSFCAHKVCLPEVEERAGGSVE